MLYRKYREFLGLLKHGKDQFDVTITPPSYFDGTVQGSKEDRRRRFKGRMMYKDEVRYLSVGIITALEGTEERKSYYLTESAYDSGTGLFNKRAINEYTIERIRDCQNTHEGLYLAIIDVDDFKTIMILMGICSVMSSWYCLKM